MSTRSTIQVEGLNSVAIYKHFDGYLEATLPWLHAFNKRFNEERGEDPESKFAQLLRDSVFSSDRFFLDKSKVTGWGVVECIDGCLPDIGQEYGYLLSGDSIRAAKFTAPSRFLVVPDSLPPHELPELIENEMEDY